MDRTEGGFRLLGPIGAGATGQVWRARAPDGTAVALKVARPELRDSPVLLRLMEGEIRALARLDHPRVAWLYDHGRTSAEGPFPPGCPYIVLEYCSGGTLAERPVSDWAGARDVLVGLLQALAHAHAHGIVHRDLKPANVLWSGTTDLRPGMKLADFGVAYAMDAGERAMRLGTPAYMAPEQADSAAEVGPWTDLYALGALAWELVTGRPPHRGDDLQSVLAAARNGPPDLRPRFPIPDPLEDWLRALLHPDPTRRVRHSAGALAQLARLDPLVPTPDAGWRPVRGSGPRLRLQGAGLGLVALREPEVAGRTEERSTLWAELEAAREGPAVRVVVVRGVSGIGKSRLCRWLTERAAELGLADPITVGCREGEVLTTLLAGVLRVPTVRVDRAEAVLTTLRLRDPETADRLEGRLREGERAWGAMPAIRRLMVRELASGPRILVLDDVQQSVDAVRLVRALLTDAPATPLLVVVTVEDDPLAVDPEVRDQLDGLCRADGVQTLALGALSGAEQEELLRTLVDLDPESQSEVLTRAGGHPGHLVAQVTHWAGHGRLSPSDRGFRRVTPEGEPAQSWADLWTRWMAAWLATLDEHDRWLLERAAVVGRVVDEALWERACDDPQAHAGPDRVQLDLRSARRRAILVDRLIGAGLAYDIDHGFTFSHPALVEVLVDQARAGGRLQDHHRACANHLRQRPQPIHALALGHHLAEAEAWDEAALTLVAGINHAWRHQDRRPLLTELERAERCVVSAGWAPDDPRQAELLHLRALLMLTAGRLDEATGWSRQAYVLADRSGDRTLRSRALWRLVDGLVVASRWTEAEPVLRLFLALGDPGLPAHWAGLARSRLGRAIKARGDPDGGRAWFEEAERELAVAPESPEGLGARLEVLEFLDRHEEVLELGARTERVAAEDGRLDLQVFSISKRVEALTALGRFDEAIPLGLRSLRLNDQLGDHRYALFMRCELALVEFKAGRLREALRLLNEVLPQLDRDQYRGLVIVSTFTRLRCALAFDDAACVDRDLGELESLLQGDRLFEPDQLWGEVRELADLLRVQGQTQRVERLERLGERILALRAARRGG